MHNPFSNLEDFFLHEARAGMAVKWADIIFGKNFIYILSPQNNLYPCVIFQGIFSAKDYKSPPRVHVCNCENLWNFYENAPNLRAKMPLKNSFDFKVNVARTKAIKEFYDLRLELCENCKAIYKRVFGLADVEFLGENFWQPLFKNKEVRKAEERAIIDSMKNNAKFSPMEICARNGHFALSYKRNEK